MFLIERVIGLFTYSVALLGAMLGISLLARKQYKLILVIYLLILSAFAYFFVPNTGSDLFRLHTLCLNNWCHSNFDSLWLTIKQVADPTWFLFSWGIYQLTHNINWLQTVTCLWGFGCIFYILSRTIETNQIYRFNRALLLFLIMSVGTFYMEMLTGIRSMLSFSIICFCLYREWIENKSFVWDLPLYLFAALLHTAGPVLIGMRIIAAGLFQKNILVKIGSIISSLGLLALLFIFGRFFIESSTDKALAYATATDGFSYGWEIAIGLLEQLQLYLVLYYYFKKYQKETANFRYTQLAKFAFGLGLISLIGLGFSYSIFRRFTIVATILIVPIFGRLLSGPKPPCSRLFIQSMWILCTLIFILSCIRSDLCSYKFFLLG